MADVFPSTTIEVDITDGMNWLQLTRASILGNIPKALEAVARKHNNYIKAVKLDAPGPPVSRGGISYPDRVHQDTTRLHNAQVVRMEDAGQSAVLTNAMRYASEHHGPGTRDLWNKSLEEREPMIIDEFQGILMRQSLLDSVDIGGNV